MRRGGHYKGRQQLALKGTFCLQRRLCGASELGHGVLCLRVLFDCDRATPVLSSPPLPLQHGVTPLHEAAFHDQLEFVRLLLDRGADKEVKDEVRGEGKGDIEE